MQRLLIIGCGDVAQRALPWLTRHYRVYATARSAQTAALLRAKGVTPLFADLDDAASLKRLAGIAELVLHSAPPQDAGITDLRTRRLIAALGAGRSLPRRLTYISTTGVYGDCQGNFIDETRPPRAQSPRGQRRVDAEGVLRRFGRRTGVGVSILRAPGIYGADRLPVERIRRGDQVLRAAEDVHTNHIHAEDLGYLCGLALSRGRPGRVYNASDDTCLKMGDYFDQVADAFGLPRPPRVTRDEARARLKPMTLSFMQESRRLGNARIKRELRARLRYPDTAAGLAAALRATTTR